MSRKILLVLALLVFAYFGGRMVVDWMRPEEDKVFLVLSRMVDGYNDGSPKAAVEGLAPDFREESGLTKDEILGGLAHFRMQGGGGSFPWRIELDRQRSDVSIDGEKASVKGPARFLPPEGSEPVWTLEFEATFERRDGKWLVIGLSMATESGERPF